MKNKKKKDENLMSWSLAAVSCDNYGAVHSFLNGVFSVLCTYKLREELKLPPEVPSGPRPIVRAESGPISAVVFFSSAHLPQESSLSPSKGPPTPSNVWVGFGLSQQPPGSLPGWDRPGSCHPRRELDLDLGRDRKLFWQQAPGRGWGEATCPLEGNRTQLGEAGGPWAPTTLCAPSVTSHSPLGEKSPGLGATRTHPCCNRLWVEQGVRLNFLLGVLLKRLNLWESLGSPVVNRTRRSHSGRAFNPWSGN